jgi:hypothetical protein
MTIFQGPDGKGAVFQVVMERVNAICPSSFTGKVTETSREAQGSSKA